MKTDAQVEYDARRSEVIKARWANPDFRKKVTEAHRRYWSKPGVRTQRARIAKSALAAPEVRRRISEGTRTGLGKPGVRARLSEGLRRVWANDPARRQRARARAVEIFSNPAVKEKARLAHATPGARKRLSEGNKRTWANDPARRAKVSKWARNLWAERRAKLAAALPLDWRGKPMLWRIIGMELLSQEHMSNRALASRLDAAKVVGGPDAGTWGESVSARSVTVLFNRIRKWVQKPGTVKG